MDNPPTYGARRRDPNRFFHEVMEEAVFAEGIGLNSVWLPEHHFGLFGCLADAAVVTGDAERCIAHLKQVEQEGIAQVILYFNVGLYPHADTMAMMERF